MSCHTFIQQIGLVLCNVLGVLRWGCCDVFGSCCGVRALCFDVGVLHSFVGMKVTSCGRNVSNLAPFLKLQRKIRHYLPSVILHVFSVLCEHFKVTKKLLIKKKVTFYFILSQVHSHRRRWGSGSWQGTSPVTSWSEGHATTASYPSAKWWRRHRGTCLALVLTWR